MKKSLFIIAATALVISCSSNDSFKEIETQDVPIGFGNAYIGKITKANDGEMNATTIATNGNTMEVWGWKYNANQNPAYTQVFDNTVVTYNSSSTQTTTSWEYSPLKFWDRAASYNFY
ncbi:MAG: hypothetical protein ACSW76_06840, partial [Bacteroidaceae bacterium]